MTGSLDKGQDVRTSTAGMKVLGEMDKQKTRFFHIKTIVIAGMGFFTDSYDLFSIGLLTKLIGRIYYQGATPINITSAITGVALCGTLAGQLAFGWAGDLFGRKKVFTATLLLMIVSAITSSMSFGRTPEAVVGTLCFWRFFLGFGVGGDYPLSATIMSEYSSKSNRGAFVAAVFAMQGFGILAAALVTLIVAHIFRKLGTGSPESADYVWRIVLMFAAFPTAATLYTRAMMPETPRYTLLIENNLKQAEEDMAQVLGRDLTDEEREAARAAPANPTHAHTDRGTFGQFAKRYMWPLIGCATCWFMLDVAFYSQGLFQSDVFTIIGWIPKNSRVWTAVDNNFLPPTISPDQVCSTASWEITDGSTGIVSTISGTFDCNYENHGCKSSDTVTCWESPLDETIQIAQAQLYLALFSTVPGYWMTVLTIEKMGRWKIQMMGFFFMTLFMSILAGAYTELLNHTGAFVSLYALTFFFANWGPNATTFVVPAEVFPAVWRTTGHGICAAAGKAGAMVGAFGFLYASKDPSNPSDRALYGDIGIGLQKTLGILAAVNFIGLLFTFLVPETKGKSLEELEEYNKDGLAKPGASGLPPAAAPVDNVA